MSSLKRLGVSLVLALVATTFVAGQGSEGVDILLGKARSLEARGRMDLAAQNWNQVLLVDPNQREALAGLAREAKQSGNAEGVRLYLERLRKVNPRDPAITAIERMRVLTQPERARLDQAVRLATDKRPDDAMKIYREVFGTEAPWGKWAETYYQTLAVSTGGRTEAINRLRALSKSDPGNEVYRLWLARILSYDQDARLEAMRLLESIRDSGTAEQARPVWRQAIVWEKDNPAVQPSLEAYLKRYPDAELSQVATRVRDNREKADQEADKQRGFRALQRKDMSTAAREFEDVLRRSPKDVNALVGLGFVRLDRKEFAEALVLFDKARALAPSRADIREGYENAQYWSAIERGQALEQRDPDRAIAAYEEALGRRPQEEQPVLAIGQIMLRRERLPEAAARFDQVLKRSPSNVDAMIGLGFVRLKEKNFAAAVTLLGKARSIAPNRTGVEEGYTTARFWGVMTDASAAFDKGNADAAMKGYEQALTIDPASGDALLGLAGAAERLRKLDVALRSYERLTTAAPNDSRVWLGLLRVQIASDQVDAAARTFRAIPDPLRRKLEQRPDYLAQLSMVLFATHRETEGDKVLGQALEAAAKGDSDESLGIRLQIANILVEQGQIDRAIAIYSNATELHPTNVIAWQGLVGAYAAKRDFDRASSVVRTMPRATLDAASQNTGFLNAVAASYAAGGRCSEAEQLLTRSLNLDRTAGRTQSAETQLQLADIWMRQAQYDKAAEAYRTVIAANDRSVEAWRGYIVALHNRGDDRTMLTESRRLPKATRDALAKDPGVLSLLAGAESQAGQYDNAVALLENARAVYRTNGRTPPADVDLQLGWAMLKSSQSSALGDLIARTRARTDLTAEQRAAVDDLWLSSLFSRVDAAMNRGDASNAAMILTEAWREAPKNPKIPSALAALYLKRGDRGRAMEVYQTWGLQGAEAGDYRAAAGAALAAHDSITADRLLREGLQKWPADRDLLRMTGRQAVSHGDYREAEKLLKAALAAKPTPPSAVAAVAPRGAAPRSESSERACTQEAPRTTPSASSRVNLGPRVIFASLQRAVDSPVAAPQTTPPNPQQTPPPAPPVDQQSPPANPQSGAPPVAAPAQEVQSEAIADDIDAVKNRNTPFASMGAAFGGRAGDPGLSRLIVRDVAPGGSVTIGNTARFGVDVHSLTLTSGTPDGLSGYRFGTLPLGATFAEQRAEGVTADLQFATSLVGLTFGTAPTDFLVKTWTGGLRIGPNTGAVRLLVVRDRVKDSLLSYAGQRDPGTGTVWGGVVSNAASLQMSHDSRGNGMYLSVGGAILQGQNVEDNWNAEASAGAYWTVSTGGPTSLTLGVAGSAMHYNKNLSSFSLGNGGYFSPQRYIMGAVPLSWTVRHARLSFDLQASPGFQYFNADSALIYPLGIVPAVRSPFDAAAYDEQKGKGANYNVFAKAEYRIAPHWHLAIFGGANNTRDFNTSTIGVSLKLLANRLPASTNLRALAVPDWRGNQPLGP